MTARINLLKTTEFRRQGLVSTSFIIRAGIMTVALFSLVFGVLALSQHRNARQMLFSAQELWRVREPIYRKILAMKQDLATKRKLDQELQGWKTSRIEWSNPLAVLQQIVPPALQFRRLTIWGNMDISIPKITKVKAAKGGAAKAEAATVMMTGEPAGPIAGGTPARSFSLLIEGRATGEKAEDTVLQFDAALREEPVFRALLQSVRLQRLQSEEGIAGGEAGRAFSIEASTARREMP